MADAHQAKLRRKISRPEPKPVSPQLLSRRAANDALGRIPTGAMNKTETLYARELEMRKHSGKVTWYKFEGMKFRLAGSAFYTPDFAVMLATGALECHEVKGFWRDDARLKIKVAASMYPIRFIAVTKRTQKTGGGFSVEEF